MRLKSTY